MHIIIYVHNVIYKNKLICVCVSPCCKPHDYVASDHQIIQTCHIPSRIWCETGILRACELLRRQYSLAAKQPLYRRRVAWSKNGTGSHRHGRELHTVQNEEPVGITWDINRVVKDGFIMTARVWTTSTGHINGIVTHWSVYTSV